MAERREKKTVGGRVWCGTERWRVTALWAYTGFFKLISATEF